MESLGHNAPVTLLKLDPLGKILLSGDDEGRDRSIRLWDLSSGEFQDIVNLKIVSFIDIKFPGSSLAVYTPKKQITACELTSNGKHVVLALKNSQKLITLELKGGDYQSQTESQDSTYGNKENEAKVFELV